MTAAHQNKLLRVTAEPKPINIPINKIASVGYPLSEYADIEKVQRMQRSIKRGEPLKPVRVIKLTDELRDKYGVRDKSKTYFLNNGHHRFAAARLGGLKKVRAVLFADGLSEKHAAKSM